MLGKLKNKLGESDNGSKFEEIIKAQWPKIETMLLERLGPVAADKLNNEEFITKTFETTYECLPMPVRMILKKEKFMAYCMEHKDPIIAKLSTAAQPA
ncbi:hypothetical protein [Thaumasiovibrio sp. DFM-14]|uniref:hypothetical protein n=1 Tax=Thaumasiovibrio sp. DFM-14 TaxID=3384792 RepID=UPI00399F98DD